MFQPHFTDAAATAIIEGLAVAKYNQNESKWETSFLRNCGHYPRLTVREVDRQSGSVISVLVDKQNLAPDNSISITVTNPKTGTDWRFIKPGDFDKKTADPQDLRWMLDIDALTGKRIGRKTNGIETNSLTISDGCFYTSVLTKKFYKKRWIPAQGNPTPFEPLGITGKTFGVDFKGDSVTVEVKGSNGFKKDLSNKPNSRFEIIFDNTCVDDIPPPYKTDFHNYYKLFNDNDGKVELQLEAEAGSAALTSEATTESQPIEEPAPSDAPLDAPAEEPLSDPDQDPKIPACQSITEGFITP